MEIVAETAQGTGRMGVGKPTYQGRIDALRKTRLEHTDLKIKRRGYYDIDDHSYIPWPEPIAFTPHQTIRVPNENLDWDPVLLTSKLCASTGGNHATGNRRLR